METIDPIIEREVHDELCSHHSIHANDVHVSVHGGIVKLMGTVRSMAESATAQQAAFGVRGVVDVVNGLNVQSPGGPPQSDADIARAVRHALVWNVLVPDEVISTNVTDGNVRLHGTVDDPTERDEAEQSVRQLAGVRHVHNLLEVRRPDETLSNVKKAIDTALDRQASGEAQQIRIDAHEGRVTLSGVVNSIADKTAVLRAAASASGVRGVEDHLRVDGAV
jgi:osmotically-inducible protein OsmY